MNRSARLNLLLGVDPSEFKQAIDKAVGGELRRVKVNVDAQLDGAGDSFGRSVVAQISKATVKADFSNFVADQLATRIANATGKAVEESVRKGFKGDFLGAVTGLVGKAVSIPVNAIAGTAKAAFSGILGSATATARTAFQGVVFGVTQSASAELGKGIQAGLQKAIGGTLGSPELIGRKLIESLSQSISQAAGRAADALEVDLPKVGEAVRKTIGEQEVLTDSRARSAEERTIRTQRKESAQVELNRERQEAFRIQTAAVEAYSRITQSIERQSVELVKKNSEAIRTLRGKLSELAADANQDAESKELQRRYATQLNLLLAPAVELEKIQLAAKAKLEEAFAGSRQARANFAVAEGGEAYRQRLIADAKVLDTQQIDIAKRIQQQQQILTKGLKVEAKLSTKLEAAPDAEKNELAKLQAEAQRNIKAIAKDINDLRATRSAILDEIAEVGTQARAMPQGPNKVVASLLKEFGAQNIPADRVPQIQLATGASLKDTTQAQYLPELNVIQVRQDLFDALRNATSAVDLTSEQQRLIREEVFHSLQFDLGSLQGLEALDARSPLVRPTQISPEEIRQAGKELDYYAPDVQQIELEAKIAANRGTSVTTESAERTAQQQELFKKAGFGGIGATEIFNEALQNASESIRRVEQRADALGVGIDSSNLTQAITTVATDLEKLGSEALQVASGEFDSIKISEINQDFDRVKVTIQTLNSEIAELSTGLERQAKEVKQSGNIDSTLSVIVESGRSVSTNLEQLGIKLSPAANAVGGAIEQTTRGLIAVGKAGLALADRLGFAASSLVPGGALAYGPAKEAIKFAGPAVAAGALATQVPAAGEIISAISSAISAVIGPATSGLSAEVGHAVSAEIAGALPGLFSALSRLVSESGLPGSEITSAAVDKLGGGLTHLLEPVVSGVARTADSTIVSIGHAVNEFLGDVGGLLLAGKGLQEGVKLATSPEARANALDAIEQVGSGVGQTINGITDGVEDVKDALDRTKRAVEKNVEEIKAGTQELAQGNIRAIADIKDSAEAAVLNIVRGAQDVGKAVGTAGQEVREGVGKVVDARPKVDLAVPDPWLIEPKTVEVKAQAIELDVPRVTYDVPPNAVDIEVEEIDLVVDPKTKLDEFREQLSRLDEAKDAKINEIRNIYQEIKKDVAKSETAAVQGDTAKLKELQRAIALKRDDILKQVDSLSKESDDILQALNALGIETGANTAIRDKVSALRQSLTKTRQGVTRQTSSIPDSEEFQSLQSINTDPKSIDQIQNDVNDAIGRIESSLYEFGRVADKINDFVVDVSAAADAIGNIPTTTNTNETIETYNQFVDAQKDRKNLLELEAERQRRIAELDELIASESKRIGDEKAEQIVSLKRQRANLQRPVQQYQADDLEQFATRKVTVNPTDEERGLVAQKRLERDVSERQISETLRRGKAPDVSPEENQIAADLAIASFEKNFAKFNATAEKIENGSTKAQQSMRKAGETFSTFREKVEENGGLGGILNKVGDSLNRVADKAGLPTGTLGKLGGIIKGVGIAALAYVGITELGDALITLGRQAFEVSTRVETLQTQLKFVGGESNLPENLKFIREESERLKRPLSQVTEGFAQLTIATRDTSLEGRTQEIASVIGTLGRVYGLSNENLTSIQYQLGQTIRLGRAQGDELRSLSDAGVNVSGALEKVLGKSATDVRKQLEAGQISATAVVDALKLLADTAKEGLPEALKTSQAELEDLGRKFENVSVLAGQKFAPVVKSALQAVGSAIEIAVAGAGKLEPFFSAIGEALGLVLDVATPVAGAIAAIGGAIANDLIQGAAIPFQIIGAGLTEIRKGFDALESAATKALDAISSSLPAGLGEILKHANPVTLAIKALGILIGVNLVAAVIDSSIAIVGAMVPALTGMATTIGTTLIPAIQSAITASLAFIATPLGATIFAIGATATVATAALVGFALAAEQAAIAGYEKGIEFNKKYTDGLDQLQKGIPLTAEKLKELKDGFIQNAKEGKGTAKEAAILSANLDRLQANAEAAAKIQGDLAEAMRKSTEAIKNQSKAIDSNYNERLAGLNEALAGQAITRERFDAEELTAQESKTAKYVELYQTQGDSLRAALSRAQAQLLQPIPDAARAEVVKQVVELEAQINDIETKSSEQRIGLAQNRVKRLEKIEKDRADRAANEIKELENIKAAGVSLQREIEIEQKISANKQSETKRRIAEIDRQLKTEVSASGKLSEIAKNLYSERAVLETELTEIVSEETTKRYEILTKNLEESRDKLAQTIAESEVQANIELQNAQNAGLLKQAQVESKKTDITRDRLQKELALELANIEELEALPSPTDPKKAEAHQKLIRAGKLKTGQLVQSLAENEYKRQQEIRQAAEKAIDEQVKGIENAATKIEQLGKVATNSLERQNKILEAQKSLRASIVGLHDEEFKILIETETNERDKADLQEKAAKFRLDSLRESQAFEERILELQQQQEQLQSRLAIIRAQATVEKAELEKKKVDDNPEATENDRKIAEATLTGAKIDLGAAIDSAQLQQAIAEVNRQKGQADNRKELLSARFDYAKSIVDPSDREDAIERVRASAARGLRERNEPQKTPRFVLPTPVNLNSGLTAGGLQLTGLSDELKQLRLLTQNGVAANLIALVSATDRTNTYLSTMAGRQPVTVQRNNTTVNNNVRSSGGLPGR
jgi:tape measure domain-containing protein